MKILALLFILITTLPLNGAVISSIERLDSPIEPSRRTTLSHNFNYGPVWSDHTFTFRAFLPSYLIGGDMIRTPYLDSSDADFQLRVTLDAPATLFLLIDNGIPDVASTMPWLSALGFADTGDDAIVQVSSDSVLTTTSIYSGWFPAGDIILLQQNYVLNRGGMYIVGATPSTNVPEPASLSFLLVGAAFCFRRRSFRTKEKGVAA